MNAKAAALALSVGTGVSLEQWEDWATELEGTGYVDTWDQEACALLVLRGLAPELPIENLFVDLAWLPLDGIHVQDAAGSWWLEGQAASETPYTQTWGNGSLMLGSLVASHLGASARGWFMSGLYPFVTGINVHQVSDGLMGEVGLCYGPPAATLPVRCSLLYGDTRAWAREETPSRTWTIGSSNLGALINEIRLGLAPKGQRYVIPRTASRVGLNPCEDAIDKMLADQIADKNATVH
jgi:hypothetical protein